ncbi:MAG TPA: aldo/keto reductase [Jiangellaceae bacterium]|nr:aldo/keto reductase [Jiangellaceae bacterium]
MRYRPLGNSGLTVSVVGLGTNNVGWRLDAEATRSVVDAAQEAGITVIDTADIYGEGVSETFLGQALAGRRDQFVIATKFGHQGVGMPYGPAAGARAGRAYIRRAVEGSLQRLGTDYIDLYQLHTPDPITPLEETVDALDDLVRTGKVRYVGHSNLSATQVAEFAAISSRRSATPFISAQHRWSLLQREVEAELVPTAVRHGLGILPYSPLANGMLTGKVRRGAELPAGSRIANRPETVTEDLLDRIEALIAWVQARDRTLLEVAVGWLAAQPGCGSVIAGATSPAQVKANAQAGDWIPTAADLADIDGIVPPPA